MGSERPERLNKEIFFGRAALNSRLFKDHTLHRHFGEIRQCPQWRRRVASQHRHAIDDRLAPFVLGIQLHLYTPRHESARMACYLEAIRRHSERSSKLTHKVGFRHARPGPREMQSQLKHHPARAILLPQLAVFMLRAARRQKLRNQRPRPPWNITQARVRTCMLACMQEYAQVYMHTHIHTHKHACMLVNMHTFSCAH